MFYKATRYFFLFNWVSFEKRKHGSSDEDFTTEEPHAHPRYADPSASFIVMLFASFPSCSTWPGRADQHANQSQSKSCILTRRQKITPIKLAQSNLT